MEIALDVLGYPRALDYSASNPSEVSKLVQFLEDRHIRHLPVDNRLPLRSPGSTFDAAFIEYLERLGCPLPSISTLDERIHWLVNHAVSVSYEDSAATTNSSEALEHAETSAGQKSVTSTEISTSALPQDAVAIIADLVRTLQIRSSRGPVESLQNVQRALRAAVIPSATGVKVGAERTKSPRDLLIEFGSGISTGVDVQDQALSVLRMLYVADLRELQDAVNEILVEVQSYTADPKTDSSLGVVGR